MRIKIITQRIKHKKCSNSSPTIRNRKEEESTLHLQTIHLALKRIIMERLATKEGQGATNFVIQSENARFILSNSLFFFAQVSTNGV